MKLRFHYGWWLAVLIVLGAMFAYGFLSLGPKVPVYEGKTLYEWAAQLQQAQQPNDIRNYWLKVKEAQTALRAMGTNALPFVMADVQARPTVKDQVIAWLAPRLRFLKLKPPNVADRWVRGIRALEALGPLAKPYLPELITLASNSTGYAESALMAVGPDALPAFTNLLSTSKYPKTGNLIGAFANAVYAERIKPEEAAVALPYLVQVLRSSDSHGRWYAAGALGAVHQEPELCIPLLIQGFTDSTPSVRQASINSLAAFGDAASSHAGQLADAYDQADANTRQAICRALGSFRSAQAIVIPVLVRALEDNTEAIRMVAATGLGQMGSLPEQVVPALIKAVDDPSRFVRLMAVSSLGQQGRQATNAVPALERACSDPDESVRKVAVGALSRVKSK